ncbi:MAG: hypothetical protein WC308_01730 [archaeon]
MGSLPRGKKSQASGKPGLSARVLWGAAERATAPAEFILRILPGGRKVYIKKGGHFDPKRRVGQKSGVVQRGSSALSGRNAPSQRKVSR